MNNANFVKAIYGKSPTTTPKKFLSNTLMRHVNTTCLYKTYQKF